MDQEDPSGRLAMRRASRIFDQMKAKFTAIVRKEEDLFVAFNPELDITSQGDSRSSALANLQEAVNLYLESASSEEIEGKLSGDAWITHFETDYAPA